MNFCCFLSLWYTFGGGTRLDIGSVTRPTVTVLPASSEEISSKQTATLMCVVSKGFPSDWSLSWKVDGNSRSQENSAGLLQKDGLYSWSSSLTLSEHDWIKSVSVSCEATRGDQTVTGQVKRDQCSQ
ncbi:immunoglobulin light chain 1 [Triplophysa rosa]|nr:immunoglobulin light chain 1 [Triplophysa rosa]